VKVELIAVTKYLWGNGTPEELLEHAGRVCYRSEKRGEAGSFLQARIREGHGSIIEHASATFEISGISRACSHQLVRHRIASYSQESQRYVDLSDPEFVVPRHPHRGHDEFSRTPTLPTVPARGVPNPLSTPASPR
jgi:thymidylate synthase (FAD)